MQYSWPGNVRQLESVLERSYIMCEAGTIGMEYVPAEVRHYSQPRAAIDGITSRLDELIDAKLTAAEYRLYLYLTKLDRRDGVSDHLLEPKEIAECLGISRDTFFVGVSKLKELGLYDYKARANELKHSPGRSPRKE
jgi:DNA-binding NtrC family response regulator